MVAQALTGLIETWWLSRLGTDVLTGMAVLFPAIMLMQMMSGGAIGGGIASAISRALGADRRDEADAFVLHAIVINVAFAAIFSTIALVFGADIYRALGARGASLDAALRYSNVVFSGMVLLWVMNGLAAIIRGTSNMLVPAFVIAAGVVILVPLSPLLIFGWGPVPALGVAGGGAALLLYYLGSTLFFAWYVGTGRAGVHFRFVPLRWAYMREILRIGALSALASVQTNLTIFATTALVGAWFGPHAVAGYGTAARLEYLMIPLVFGIGATLVAMVGMNVGAGQGARALRIALTGAAAAFVICETIGVVAAIWPEAWLRLFASDPATLVSGSRYLHLAGPCFGFYGLGFALYFAGQGAGRILWPMTASFARLVVTALGGWFVLRVFPTENALYVMVAIGLLVYCCIVVATTVGAGWTRASLPRVAATV